MVVKKKRQFCKIKDHSPLGLLGILLITAGVIIAIYDAKDALPNTSASYVVVIGVILILLGMASVIVAFLGYRRSRATSRESTGTKMKGKSKLKKVQWRKSRRVSIGTNSRGTHARMNGNAPDGLGGMAGEAALVSLPHSYSMDIPRENAENIRRSGGADNQAFDKSPLHAPAYTILGNTDSYNLCTRTPYQSSETTVNSNGLAVCRINTEDCHRSRDVVNTPPSRSWSSIQVAEYAPPVSTIV